MILDNYKQFLEEFFKRLKETGIDLSELTFDHLGYMAATIKEYEKLKSELLELGDLDHENDVGDKWRVFVIKLKKPLEYDNYSISVLEMVCPIDGRKLKTGFEHVEFVPKMDFDSLMKKYPNLDWDTSSADREEYAMLKLKLGDDMQVKFPKQCVLKG